jgi:hypothetical protein
MSHEAVVIILLVTILAVCCIMLLWLGKIEAIVEDMKPVEDEEWSCFDCFECTPESRMLNGCEEEQEGEEK